MRRLFTLLALLTLAAPASAADLRIGRATEHGSLDPLYSLLVIVVMLHYATYAWQTIARIPARQRQ